MNPGNEPRRSVQAGSPPVSLLAERNAYLPRRARIQNVIKENAQVMTFELSFEDELYNADFTYLPGQFVMLSLPHCGEAPFSFSSSPTKPGVFSLSIRKAGKLTSAAHHLRPGDMVGVRGPYGRSFPLDDLKGGDLLIVAGGIGLAPLRSVLEYCVDNRHDYGSVTLLYGCRHPGEFCFQSDLDRWQRSCSVNCLLTVDKGDETWTGRVGLVTQLLDEVDIGSGLMNALVCGPGIMIRYVIERLLGLGLPESHIITTLENHMKCGIGVCGHCHFDDKLICTDGPVFHASQLNGLENL
jgi:NAD(P)H-flavin reductase